jgi:hypothetical protein
LDFFLSFFLHARIFGFALRFFLDIRLLPPVVRRCLLTKTIVTSVPFNLLLHLHSYYTSKWVSNLVTPRRVLGEFYMTSGCSTFYVDVLIFLLNRLFFPSPPCSTVFSRLDVLNAIPPRLERTWSDLACT